MIAALTIEDYLSAPVGHYLCGPTYIVWWLNVRLNGMVFWGRPEEDHIRRMVCAIDSELAPGVEPHASIVDARYMEAVDLGAFNALSQYVRSRAETFSRTVTGQAVLRPGGLVGAAVAGFHAVLGPSYPARVFSDPALAFEWLGIPDLAFMLEELDDIRSRTIGESYLVSTLRTQLERNPGAMSLKDAARALGVSPRDLQRKLREAHTRFRNEQNDARVRIAKRLLLETNYDLKRIAIEVGGASAQHFSVLFRHAVGESPSQWRARQRPDLPPPRSQR